jgi:hypothetical protein
MNEPTIPGALAAANRRSLASVAFMVGALAWMFSAAARRNFAPVRLSRAGFALALLIVAMSAMTACGGGGGGPPPPTNHTYTIPITGSAGNLKHSTSVQLVVD